MTPRPMNLLIPLAASALLLAGCAAGDPLAELRGRAAVAGWQALARAGDWPALYAQLMREHYDPLYERSLRGNFRRLAQAEVLALPDAAPATLRAAAARLIAAA